MLHYDDKIKLNFVSSKGGVMTMRWHEGHFRATRGSKAVSGGRLEDPRESRVMSKVTHRINSNN